MNHIRMGNLLKTVLKEAHHSKTTIHPSGDKMYRVRGSGDKLAEGSKSKEDSEDATWETGKKNHASYPFLLGLCS